MLQPGGALDGVTLNASCEEPSRPSEGSEVKFSLPSSTPQSYSFEGYGMAES